MGLGLGLGLGLDPNPNPNPNQAACGGLAVLGLGEINSAAGALAPDPHGFRMG